MSNNNRQFHALRNVRAFAVFWELKEQLSIKHVDKIRGKEADGTEIQYCIKTIDNQTGHQKLLGLKRPTSSGSKNDPEHGDCRGGLRGRGELRAMRGGTVRSYTIYPAIQIDIKMSHVCQTENESPSQGSIFPLPIFLLSEAFWRRMLHRWFCFGVIFLRDP